MTLAGGNTYPYMQQLASLDAQRPQQPQPHLPAKLQQITTPLHPHKWEELLQSYPDRDLAQYVVAGLRNGFRIGFNRDAKLTTCSHNMLSATQFPQVIDDYLRLELELERVVVIPQDWVHIVHTSPFGVIPKKHKPGKWRLILDLSSPAGLSVNDGIDKDLCSLSYISIDEVVKCIISQGQGAMLAKIDVKQAYRNIPVHPEDRPLLGMAWKGKVYLDKVLPFGLRSAPLIFSAIADALQWIIQAQGVEFLFHYLDDFITIGRPATLECENNLSIIKHCCDITGTPLEQEKVEGPSTCLPFLGIELDTEAMEIRLPADKLLQLRQTIGEWAGRKAGRKRALLSLIGLLNHACKAVRQGRSFLRRLINVSASVQKLDGFVRLNASAQSDIYWWKEFAAAWNGISMLTEVRHNSPEATITSDASGLWGCGAYCGAQWFQLQWSHSTMQFHITIKELIPVVLALAIWGRQWCGKTVQIRCDNAAVVAILNSGDSRDPDAMHLRRCLAFITAKFNINLFASHVKGKDNGLADALSRNKAAIFFSANPQASLHPSPIPAELLDLLILQRPDWRSPNWTNLWSVTFGKV